MGKKKYQYKIIRRYPNKTFYKFECDCPYPFSIGEKIWFPETWKKELGGEYTWEIVKIEHYIVEHFIAIYVKKESEG